MSAGLREDEIDAAFGIDLRELGDGMGEQFAGIAVVEIGERAAGDAHEAIGPVRPQSVQGIRG